MKEDYGELHPKNLELGLRLINESYQSSNQRCIAMLLALKSFVNVRRNFNGTIGLLSFRE